MSNLENLLVKRDNLKQEMKKIDAEIKAHKTAQDAENLHDITDKLNTMFQNKTLEEHAPDAANKLYEIMQEIDKVAVALEQEAREAGAYSEL